MGKAKTSWLSSVQVYRYTKMNTNYKVALLTTEILFCFKERSTLVSFNYGNSAWLPNSRIEYEKSVLMNIQILVLVLLLLNSLAEIAWFCPSRLLFWMSFLPAGSGADHTMLRRTPRCCRFQIPHWRQTRGPQLLSLSTECLCNWLSILATHWFHMSLL